MRMIRLEAYVCYCARYTGILTSVSGWAACERKKGKRMMAGSGGIHKTAKRQALSETLSNLLKAESEQDFSR